MKEYQTTHLNQSYVNFDYFSVKDQWYFWEEDGNVVAPSFVDCLPTVGSDEERMAAENTYKE